jgi:hypothetical protein
MRLSHADVIRGANFIVVMFKLESEVNLCSSSGLTGFKGGTRL